MYRRHRTRTTAQGASKIDGENPYQATRSSNQNHDRLIHRFPPEIASRIFFYCFLASSCLDTHEKTNTLRLRAICQKWQQLAWATPEVWTWIHIHSGIIYRWNSNSEQLLAEWLERLASLPLTRLFFGPSTGDLAVYCVVMDLLNKHSARWYDIHFNIPACHFHRLGGFLQQNILYRLVISPDISSNKPLSTFRMKCSPIELKLTAWSLKYIGIISPWFTYLYSPSMKSLRPYNGHHAPPHKASFRYLQCSQYQDLLSSRSFLGTMENPE